MLLAIDIGNSNISVGLFDKARELRFLASLDTDSRKTADQISIDLMNLFTLYGCDIHDVSGAIFASVVPPINFMMEKALTRLLGKPPMMVGAGIKTGLNIRMEFNSQQLGADIVSNAVAALEKYPAPIIMIDMPLHETRQLNVAVLRVLNELLSDEGNVLAVLDLRILAADGNVAYIFLHILLFWLIYLSKFKLYTTTNIG